MNIIDMTSVGMSLIFYLIYFYLMNKIAEKKEFNHWNLLSYFYALFFSIMSIILSENLYNPLFWFVSFMLYSLLFYYNTIKQHIVNALTFYLIRYLSSYLFYLIFATGVDYLHIDATYYTDLLIDILIFVSSLSILFVIVKKILIKILITNGNEFTNNQFAILLFPSIVGFISLYLFDNYSDNQNNFDISSILLALATVCVVFILVYLANIKTLHAKEKTESSLLREKQFLKENMDIQFNFIYSIAV